MPFAERLLVIAMLGQICWTLAVMFIAGRTRFRAAERREIRGDISLDMSAMPDYARKAGNNMNNQWETPTLFYALVLLALVLHLASLLLAVLAFVYLASRIGHSYVHMTSNVVMLRARVFFVGVAALVAMTTLIILDLLTGTII